METLWAPWRSSYITKVIKNQHQGCVFCAIAAAKKDAKTYIFLRGKTCYAVLNTYPYCNGHSMVLPYRHVAELGKLTSDERLEMMDLAIQAQGLLTKAVNAQGFNIGFNLGRIAGAGIPTHLHMHVVPRWLGDHNFMPVIGKTRVISQSLKDIYGKLTCSDARTSKR